MAGDVGVAYAADANGRQPGPPGSVPPLAGVTDSRARAAKAGGLALGYDADYRDGSGWPPVQEGFVPPTVAAVDETRYASPAVQPGVAAGILRLMGGGQEKNKNTIRPRERYATGGPMEWGQVGDV